LIELPNNLTQEFVVNPTGLLPSHAQGADVIAFGSWDNLVPYVWVTREKIADIRDLRGKKSASIAPVVHPG